MDLATLGIAVDSSRVSSASGDLDSFTTSADRAERSAQKFGVGASNAAQRVEREYQRTIATIDRMRAAFGFLAGVMATGAVARMADQWSELNSRVRNAVGGMGSAEQVMDRLSAMARRTYSDLSQTAESWLSTASSLSALGVSIDTQLDIVETLNNSMVVSATRGQRAESVMRAWSNAMALGSLRGDDLNSVLTNSDRLARALADSMGVNVNELRAYGAAGKITRDELVGVTSQLVRLREEADQMPATLADGLTLMRNALLETVGVLDQAGGLSERLAGRMVSLADNMGAALTVAGAGALLLAARLGGPLAAGYASATAAVVANQAAVLSGNATMLGSTQAAASKAAHMAQLAAAERASAQTTLVAAEADLVRARNLLAAARAGQVAGVTQAQAFANVVAASRGVSAAQTALAVSTTRATAAVGAQTGAMAANTLAARAMAGATAAASSALALIGGPAGAAIIAIGAAMYLAASRAQAAQERSERYAEAIRQAGERSGGASGGIRAAAQALAEVESAATGAERAVTQAMAQADIANLSQEMNATIAQLGATMGWSSVEMQQTLQGLQREFFNGQKSAEDFISEVDRIALANPDASPTIAEIQRIAREAAAAMGVVDGLSASVSQLAEKGGRIRPLPPLGDFDFGQRWNAGWGDIGDRLRQQADQLTKSTTEVDRYGDAVKRMRENWDDATSSLRVQIETFGQSEGAIAAAEFRARTLTEAYRLAAANNEIVSTSQIAQIEQAAASIGALTDQLVSMREAAAQAERVAKAIADLEFANGLIGLSQTDREIATTLRQLQVSYESMDGQRIAGSIQYRAEQERVQEGLEKQRDLLSNMVSTLWDSLFDTNSADSFFDRIAKGFESIGKQLQQLAGQNLIKAVFGEGVGYTAGAPRPGERSIFPAGFPAGYGAVANQNTPAAANQNFSAPLLPVERRALPELTRATSQLAAAASAIRTIESGSAGGNYSAMGPVTRSGDRAYGAYQVMGNNIAEWSRSAIGREVGKIEFLRSVELQDKIFEHRFGGYMQKYGPEGASRAWFAGEGGMRNYRAQDVVGTSVGGYGSRFGRLFAQHGGVANDNRAPVAPVQVPASDPWNTGGINLRAVTPGANIARNGNTGWFGEGGRISQLMQSPLGQLGMQGIGAFGTGYSSGSAGGGALQGGLQAFLASGFNPVAGLVGLAAGALGGLFGGRQKRKQEHQQRAEAWAAQAQEWAAYQDEVRTGVGPTSGLRASQEAMAGRLTGFVQTGSAAWKMGSNNSSALFSRVGAELAEYFARTNAEFGRAYEAQIDSLNAGQGLSGPFISARDEILEAGKTLATFVDDTRVVFGDGSVEAQRAAEASIAQLRALLTGGQELSDIAAAVEQMRGAAAGLHTQLEVLGKSAEDAGQIVRDDLTTAMDRLRSDFTRGIQDQINDLDGKGYLADFRALIDGVQQTMQDAALLGGVDTSLVDTFFAKSAQNLVNQSELAGEAFDELVRTFPTLSGVVKEFSQAVVTATEAEIRSAIEGYQDRLFAAQNGGNDLVAFERQAARERVEAAKFGADAVAALEKTLAAERANIVVAGARADLDQAWREHQDAVNERIRALRDEASELERTVSRLTSFVDSIKELQDSIRLDQNLTTLGGIDLVNEAQRQYEETYRKAMAGDEDAMGQLAGSASDYLSAARDYFQTSEQYGDIFRDVNRQLDIARQTAGNQLTEAQRQLAAIEKQITLEEEGLKLAQQQYDALLGIRDGVMSLGTAMAAMSVALQNARSVGVETGTGGTVAPGDASFGRAVAYLNANPDIAAGIAAGQTFGLAPGSSIQDIARAHWERHGQYEDPTKRKGYQAGGWTGNGPLNEIAGPVHRREFVFDAPSTAAIGVPTLTAAMQMRSLPKIAMPTQVMGANQNRELAAEVKALREENSRLLRTLITTAGGGLDRVASAAEDGARATGRQELASRRANAAPKRATG